MKREKAIEAIEQLPNNFEVEQLIEKLIFIEKVEAGLIDIENGNLVSHDEVLKQASSWSKK
ncbi:MAG: hypothetical protein K0S09_3106 [Sphingobacteriaceae bacterium]|jgi:predicted transcriptional regulator|nr:hypothetical protein [Sphingobacteriaceae bacterium]